MLKLHATENSSPIPAPDNSEKCGLSQLQQASSGESLCIAPSRRPLTQAATAGTEPPTQEALEDGLPLAVPPPPPPWLRATGHLCLALGST